MVSHEIQAENMNLLFDTNDVGYLRRKITSECIWSKSYASLKYILKRTANRLPLVVTFPVDNNNKGDHPTTNTDSAILFFDRNISKKLLFTPLKRSHGHSQQFEVFPQYCTFAMSDSFKGVFEIIRNGKRCSYIFKTLEELMKYAISINCTPKFMSRDRIQGYYYDLDSATWTYKEYDKGSIFQAQYIHQASVVSRKNCQKAFQYLECLDEDGDSIFLQLHSAGRFSLIATSVEHRQQEPERFLHSTQTPDLEQIVKQTIADTNNNGSITDCIRLVRGTVPHNFSCQYARFICQQASDVLVGITKDGLLVECNLESPAPCQYAINLDDILDEIHKTMKGRILDNYIDKTRTEYREKFQDNMQLLSSNDYSNFYQYWKWSGDIQQKDIDDKNIAGLGHRQYNLFVSVQDLSADAKRLAFELQHLKLHHTSQSVSVIRRQPSKPQRTTHSHTHVNKIVRHFESSLRLKGERACLPDIEQKHQSIMNQQTPFDDSIYDSNQNRTSTINNTKTTKNHRKPRHAR